MTKILYIDDEVGLPHFESRIEFLEEEGGFTIDAMGPEEGLEALQKDEIHYRALLLDIIMAAPGLFTEQETDFFQDTGLRLLHKIRELGINIPVIVVTIKREKDVLELVHCLNVRDVIFKPLDLSSLVERVESALADAG